MTRPVTELSKSPVTERSADVIDADDLARYIADMSGEMAALAQRAGWPLVTYFLEMAKLQTHERLRQRTIATVAQPSRERRPNKSRRPA